ncbi:MAG: Rhamnan synthesis [Xanthobacteraceae bacterium]|jgi:hypothetical protein|nr:Rhamnan synthesis [Xanthobacteraceae bacterium]
MTSPAHPASPSPNRRYFEPKRRSKWRQWLTNASQKTGRSIGRLLFDAESRPRPWLRSLLFDAYQRPRPGLEGVVFKEPGRPRRPFAGWLTHADDTLPPLVRHLPFPLKDEGRRPVIVVAQGDAAPAEALVRTLAERHAVMLLVLDGAAPSGFPVAVIPVDIAGSRAPRPVLLDALAQRSAGYEPLFAVAIGLCAADAADIMEQRNIPVVALAGAPEGYADFAEALDVVLERASAVAFPSDAAKQAALSLLPHRAGRRHLVVGDAPEDVEAIGREIGAELDNELALVLATDPARLEVLAIPRDGDPPGEIDVPARLASLIAAWRRKALLRRHPNRPPLRRPYSGFHPLIYAEHHPVACFDERRYPLSHWIEKGRPEGPWAVPVFGPLAAPVASPLRVGLHGHFFYPDLLPELLERLAPNASRPDLFLTTDTPAKVEELRALTATWTAKVRIDVVPNSGRDIGPFLTALRDVLTSGEYDVLLHLHGKKTKGRRRAIGDPWRNFLWENLIGGEHPMLDAVLAHMAAHPTVGLVYPEDSHLLDWARNGRVVEELRRDMGLTEPMGTYVDFPVGNMFAIRPAALAPVLALDLKWGDYPVEPIPMDGTVLHGIERLLPMVVRKAGFTVAAVRVPGTDWD